MKKYNLYIFIILILPYIKPPTYIIGNKLDTIYDIGKIISSCIIVFVYIYKYKKISKMLLLLSLFQISFIFSTIIKGDISDIYRQTLQAISIISICMLTEYGIKKDKLKFFKAIYIVLAILALINSFTMFKYVNKGMYIDELGHWQYYFLGYDNSTFLMIFPVYIYATCYSYMKYKKINLLTWIILLIIGFSYLYVESTTAFIMIILFLIFAATYKFNIWEKILNYNVLITIVAVVFVFIAIFNGQMYFEDFMAEKLNKGVTMSGRTYIWEEAKKYILESPIIGYGSENNNILMSKFGINHIHNIVLDILYNGGIIAMLIYLLILNRCRIKLKNNKKSFITNAIILGIFIYLFSGIFDYNNNKYMFFTFFILAEYSNKLIEEKENKVK